MAPPDIARLAADAGKVLGARTQRDARERSGLGRRARSLVSRRAGKYARHRLTDPGAHDVAVDATLRAAAVRGGARGRLDVRLDDLRWKLREHRAPLSVVLVLDNSYSLRAEQMVEAAKGLALALVADTARRGDRVALVAFQGGAPRAVVALPLTRSAVLAHERLARVPLAGRTPLADGLRRGRRLLHQDRIRNAHAVPLLVAITDGLPTVPLRAGGDPVIDTLEQGSGLRRAGIPLVVADTTPPERPAAGCCAELAEAAGGTVLPFHDLVATDTGPVAVLPHEVSR